MHISIYWFRRDLRLEDNTALSHALNAGFPVQPVFIFDKNILNELPRNDTRVTFIYNKLKDIHDQLVAIGSSLKILHGDPLKVWEELIQKNVITKVFFNKDYEPYAIQRDKSLEELLVKNKIEVNTYKDQVIFEESEVVKDDSTPYTVFTPYKKKWLYRYHKEGIQMQAKPNFKNFVSVHHLFPSLESIGFIHSQINVREYNLSHLDRYAEERNLPALDSTSYLSPHLRYGTISIREIINQLEHNHDIFLSELIWREFFMQILFHFPRVVDQSFKSKYDTIQWRNDPDEFEKWCIGQTGFPMVDAGMRQLNESGYMHNRVRMVAASFLCKHLLIDWRWGETYFANKLLDYELSSNNGNWQWAAGTGCDAAPYFRVFNPTTQLEKFDKELAYIKKWIPELKSGKYPKPMVDHKFARERAIKTYREGLNSIKISFGYD